MTSLPPRQRRLMNTYLAMQALVEKCKKGSSSKQRLSRFEFTHNGNPKDEEYPDIYDVTLRVTGVKNRREEPQKEHRFMIYLPVNYPVGNPLVRWNSDIFHPNILGVLDPNDETYQELRQEFSSEDAMNRSINQDPRWEELLGSYVCLDALKENWTPFVGLDALVVEIANMVRYQTYNLNSVLNKAAATWAKEKEKLMGYFPLDTGLVDTEEKSIIRILEVAKTK